MMRTATKLLILAAFATGLSGCVVAPYGPRPYVGVGVAAPVVVVRPAYGYYYPHYYYYGH